MRKPASDTPTSTRPSRPLALVADERGIGLIASILVMLLISMMGASMMVTGMSDLGTSDNYRSSKAAFYEADSGLERSMADFMADITWIPSMLDGSDIPVTAVTTFPSSVTINGHTVSLTTSGGAAVADWYQIGTTTSFGYGTYTRQIFLPPPSVVNSNAKGSKVWVTFPARATGTSGSQSAPSSQTLQADLMVEVFRVNIWDNAVFAGGGQAGQQINGNVEVRGSMHIVGDPNNPTLLDWSGGSAVINNYRGAADNANFGADAVKLPSLPTVTYNGEVVETLDAEVRVKNGTIMLDGSADLGEADTTGDSYKEYLDGIYTENDLQYASGSATAYSDTYDDYDINTNIPFPSLDDPYVDDTGTSWTSHRDYLNASALTLGLNSIDDTTPSFSLADASGNSIDWDQGTQTLTVDGLVRVDGALDIGKNGGGNRRIEYSGTGTIYATDDINVLYDLVPTGDYLDTAAANTHNLGLIADDDMTLGGNAQVNVMAAVYAEDEMSINKQTTLGGAVVADYFDMGTNVPSIWQTPLLSSNLPPGMPGADPLLVPTNGQVLNWTHLRQ